MTNETEQLLAGVPVEEDRCACFKIIQIPNLTNEKGFCLIIDTGDTLKVIRAESFEHFKLTIRDSHIEHNWLPVICSNLVFANCLENNSKTDIDAPITIGGSTFKSIHGFIMDINRGVNTLLTMADHPPEPGFGVNVDIDDVVSLSSSFIERVVEENGGTIFSDGR